jgi:NAD(P)-dependent dehydrogenase (short-subunit alcohol dehydrogenase family)
VLDDLAGKTAVVTGGASGIGRAMGERFAQEGMRVVLADVVLDSLDATVAELAERGHDVIGVVTDVTSFESVAALRDRAVEAYDAVHVLCNNAGVGSGAEGHVWEHELNDWRWALDVNVWGVVHGLNAFLPHMLEHGEAGHVVNTSSGNGGISPLPSTPVYAVTKASVTIISECLFEQLRQIEARIGASVLYPGPNMLRTGLYEAWRHRPAEYAKEKPRATPYATIEDVEEMMRKAGVDVQYTPVEEVAGRVVDAIRADEFWILPPSERTDEQIKARADSMLKRENPAYLQAFAG